MNYFWITPKWPYPVADGARIATTQLLKNLSLQGIKIHLCALVTEDEVIDIQMAKSDLGVAEVTIIHREKTSRLRQIFSFLRHPFFPVTLAPYATASVAKKIERILATHEFDFIVYDGLHTAAWRLNAANTIASANSEIYRAHNVESDIWFRGIRETKNHLKKVVFFSQGHLVKQVEIKLLKAARYIFPVSHTDELRFKEQSPNSSFRTLPIGIHIAAPRPHPKTRNAIKNFLFIGKLNWAPNREGLKWFLETVWPKVIEEAPDLTLTIVGSGDRSWLSPYQNLPGIRVIGQVESLAPYYEECIATIVPIFYGSGTRVKAIESSLYGRVCISTEIGVEGMGLVHGENYLLVESINEWVKAMVTLERDEALRMGSRARDYALQNFNPQTIAQNFIQSVSVLS